MGADALSVRAQAIPDAASWRWASARLAEAGSHAPGHGLRSPFVRRERPTSIDECLVVGEPDHETC